MEKLIAELEKMGNNFAGNGLDEYTMNKGEEILRNVRYIKSLPNDEDRALFLRRNKDMREFVEDINVRFGDDVPEIKKSYDSIAYPKSVKRDENGLKTIDETALVQMSNADNAEDLFDVNSDKSWYHWSKEQMDKYAADAGMARGEFIKKVSELDTSNKRKHIANDGAMGVVSTIFFPRIHKAIENGVEPSYADWALDVAENVAQSVPVGKAVSAAGKVGKAYAAANGSKAVIGKAIAENAAVPTAFAFADEARSEDPDYYKAATKGFKGTLTNIFTPTRVIRNFGRVGSIAAGKSGASAMTDVYRNTTDKALNNLVTNKLGKDVYAEQGASYITSLDPTGSVDKVFAILPGGGNYEKKKEEEHQKELEEKRVKSINDDYTKTLIKSGMMERALRRKYGDANVDLWIEKPQYAPDQILFKSVGDAKKEGYDEKL